MRKTLSVTLAALCAACASDPGVSTLGPNSYLVSREAGTGFGKPSQVKADALQEAGSYCAGMGKVMQVIDLKETQPPYLLGNYPRTDVQFTCLN